MMKCIVLLSGGLDSTVLLHRQVDWLGSHNVKACSFQYRQRHNRELSYAVMNARGLGVEHRFIDISGLADICRASALLDPSIPLPEEHYTHENQKITVVPNRNMVMISYAVAWGMMFEEATSVAFAAHLNDHSIYTDCRPEFVIGLNSVIKTMTDGQVQLHAPFIQMYKSNIVYLGHQLHVDFKNTWSCYAGGANHCGVCATCQERKEAFKGAGVEDPTIYDK